MTTFLLIRHGQTDAVVQRVITGRRPGVNLTAQGKAQAERLVGRLEALSIDVLCSSPLERTVQTAEPLSRHRGLEVQTCPGLIEVEFGAWTGCSVDALQNDPHWQRFNQERANTPIPGGETMLEVQARAVRTVLELRERYPDKTVALVSHGDVIRVLLAHFCGAPLDGHLRLVVDLVSISAVRCWQDAVQVVWINQTEALTL